MIAEPFLLSSFCVAEVTGKYCGHLPRTCCTTEVEENLRELGKSDYDKTVKKVLTNLSRMLKSKSSKFNGKCSLFFSIIPIPCTQYKLTQAILMLDSTKTLSILHLRHP